MPEGFTLPPGFGSALLDFFYEWAQKSLAANQPPETIKAMIRNPDELNGVRLKLFTRRQLGLNGLRNRDEWRRVEPEAMAAVDALRTQLTEDDMDLLLENVVQ